MPALICTRPRHRRRQARRDLVRAGLPEVAHYLGRDSWAVGLPEGMDRPTAERAVEVLRARWPEITPVTDEWWSYYASDRPAAYPYADEP